MLASVKPFAYFKMFYLIPRINEFLMDFSSHLVTDSRRGGANVQKIYRQFQEVKTSLIVVLNFLKFGWFTEDSKLK